MELCKTLAQALPKGLDWLKLPHHQTISSNHTSITVLMDVCHPDCKEPRTKTLMF